MIGFALTAVVSFAAGFAVSEIIRIQRIRKVTAIIRSTTDLLASTTISKPSVKKE